MSEESSQTLPEEKLDTKKNLFLRVFLVTVVALVIGIGVGSLLYYVFVPRPDPNTAAPRNFKLVSDDFVKVDLGVEQFPDLEKQKSEVPGRIFNWVVEQRDQRGEGIYVNSSECVYALETGTRVCTNPSMVDSAFVSNQSFQAPLWGMLKRYQHTRDTQVLEQIESDLQTIKVEVLDNPEIGFVQTNDYNCLYLKDLYFDRDLSVEGKQIVYDLCKNSRYALGVSRDGAYDYDRGIAEKVNSILTDRSELLAGQLDVEVLAEYMRNSNDFKVTADMIVATQIAPDAWASEMVKPQMDWMLTQYAYLASLNNGQVEDIYNQGMVLALVYYAQFIDEGNNSELLWLAQKIYNNSFTNPEMNANDMLSFALVQYHLGHPMSQIQSSLLREFYSTEHNNFGGLMPDFFQLPESANLEGNTLTCRGSVVQNGLLMGVLSI